MPSITQNAEGKWVAIPELNIKEVESGKMTREEYDEFQSGKGFKFVMMVLMASLSQEVPKPYNWWKHPSPSFDNPLVGICSIQS